MGKLTRAILVCAAASALAGAGAAAGESEAAAREILALERKALDGWQAGNPDPCLAMADPEITYFHVVTGKRLDGLPAVKALLESYRGQSLFDSYEMAGPKVQGNGDTVVLTYILVRHVGGETTRWNSTQVYQRKKEGWRVIHSHWSATAT
ncbi:MAG: nuclear transport factor 2 family protein [Candidatus Sulfopaludibacter sp.]|nr:nuclear transport factor 2 family protein [Candidatus Sulfopaludibacter sp.]